MTKYSTIWILLIFHLTSCEVAQDWHSDESAETLLVVEGILTNERKQHEIKLSGTFYQLNDSIPTIAGAQVSISDGDKIYELTEDPGEPGTYLTDTLQAVFGKLYTLSILYQGKEYSAQAQAAVVAPIEPLLTEPTEDGNHKLIYQESDDPSMLEVAITWVQPDSSGLPALQEIHAFYYTLQVIDVNKIFAPEKETIVFPPGSIVFRRKYSLTGEHQEFLRSFLSETDWRGGAFDVAAGNVSTNLSDGAVGYFAVSMVRSETVEVN